MTLLLTGPALTEVFRNLTVGECRRIPEAGGSWQCDAKLVGHGYSSGQDADGVLRTVEVALLECRVCGLTAGLSPDPVKP